MIDIFHIKPNVITKDLSGKSFLIYGEKKSGKTSNAVKFPKPLLIAFEKGYSFLDGVIAQPVNSWREALEIKEQLIDDAENVKYDNENRKEGEPIRETAFKTVICDTADIAYDYCENFILDKENVEYLDESNNKRAYRALSKEYDNFFQSIVKAGYTLVIISHATTTQIKDASGKYERTLPTLPNRGYLVVSRLVDVCGYASYEEDAEGKERAVLTMRGNKYLEAGSRNKYMSEKIPFTYEALAKDMQQAIEKLEMVDGAKISDKPTEMYQDVTEKIDFNEAKETIKTIVKKLNSLDKENGNTNHLDKYREITDEYLGRNKLVQDTVPAQVDMLALIIEGLNKYLKANNITI